MAKRKAIMRNIIYELDNDDIEISSDDEVKDSKVNRPNSSKAQIKDKQQEIVTQSEDNETEVCVVDSTDDSVCLLDSPNGTLNGGKTCRNGIENIDSPNLTKASEDVSQDEVESDCATKSNLDCDKTSILNDNIDIDSPSSKVFCAAGCENRIPLVSVRFKDSKLLRSCRDKIKEFMIKLIKEHQSDNLEDSDNETGCELDIWPDDLSEECTEGKQEVVDNLFFVDTAPCKYPVTEIPKYSQASSVISNVQENPPSPPEQIRRLPICFNCDGNHQLRDCKVRRDNARIAQKRQAVFSSRVGRYHIEDDQKYGHLIPGRISGQLRHALGLKRHELPLHIYRMRMLGYPPGWLEEARISHSGMRMFDSTGNAILDPEEEDGEICEAGSKDKFDIKKIMDFPGFNVPASSRYTEEGYKYGLPPMSEQDSKITMLQMLAPNAMKAYKRKKLTFFPSATHNLSQGHGEMDLDSGDEETVFPLVPPLPDEAPPPLPPPPDQPPPPMPEADPETVAVTDVRVKTISSAPAEKIEKFDDNSASDIEIIEGKSQVSDDSFITIDEDSSSEIIRVESPSLVELEKKKIILLEALQGDVSTNENTVISKPSYADNVISHEIEIAISDETDISITHKAGEIANNEVDAKDQKEEQEKSKVNDKEESKLVESDNNVEVCTPSPVTDEKNKTSPSDPLNLETPGTPDSKTGHVRNTSYGTPVLNIASSFVKLPSKDKFSKDICDVIYFENLPNSTGKYEKISHLLKKVKTEVDRIQES